MPDQDDDSHLAPEAQEGGLTTSVPMTVRAFLRLGRDLGRFVRLAERQGTRLVDVADRWATAAERHASAAERHAQAMERLADTFTAEVPEPDDEG